MTRQIKIIWLANFVGNAILLALLYLWLTIPDRKTWQLVVTSLLGAIVLCGALWLHAGTFAAFRQAKPRVLTFALCLMGVVAVLWAIHWLGGHIPKWSAWLGSALTLRLHRPVNPENVLCVLAATRWLLSWIVVPVLALPLLSAASMGSSEWRLRKRFWLEYVAVYLLAWYLPSKLIHWVPEIDNFAGQLASFLLRFGLAWLLAVSGWVALARSAAMGKARE